MALEKKSVPISFQQGIDTKTDPKQVIIGKLLKADNVVFGESMAFNKRPGNELLALLDNGKAVATFKDELVSFDGSSLYSYSNSTASNIDKGDFVACGIRAESIFRSATAQTKQDSAYNSAGLYLYTWTDSTAGAQYVVVSASTGQQVVPVTNLPATAVNSRAWSIGRYLIVTFIKTSNNHLQYIAIPVADPTNPTTAADLSTQVDSSYRVYDGTVANNSLFLAWNASDLGGAVRATSLSSTLTQSSVIAKAGETVTTCITVFADTGISVPAIWVAYFNGTDIRYFVLNSNGLNTKLAPQAAVTGATDTITISGQASAMSGKLYYETDSDYSYAAVRSDFINYVTVTEAGAVGTATVLIRSVGLTSKPFKYNGIVYMVVAYAGSLQPTYFVINDSGNCIAKIAYQNGGGYSSAPCSVNAISADKFEFAYLFKSLLTTQEGQVYTQTGVNSCTIDFAAESIYNNSELGKNLNLSGGFLWAYDGYGPTEQNFHLYPEDLGSSSSTSGTPHIAAGTYNYIALYEWTDNQGNIFRSADAGAKEVVIAATSSITISIPTLRITYKQSPRSLVSITLYRDAPSISSGIFYKVSSITSPTLNSVSTDSVTITDNTADANIIGNELLYTTGGVVENTGAPSAVATNIYRNRLMMIDAENRLAIWYSKQTLAATPVEMSDAFVLYADPRFGDCTALAVLDDKEIVFKSNAIFYFTGNGPDATGANNDFSDTIFVTSNVGCDNLNSIVLTPIGLMFQTNKGIWLLNRSLQVNYIGADVEEYNADNVTSATLIPNSTQVRFTLESGVCLVYDYFYEQWNVFTNLDAIGAVDFGGFFTYLSSTGELLRETPGEYSNNGRPILMRIETGWLSLSGLQGFERIYRLYLMALYKSPHRIQIQVAYDYSEQNVQSITIQPSQVNNTKYGDDGFYGSTPTFGGETLFEQWRVNFDRQKCQAIKITIQELLDLDNPVFGAGFTLENINVVAGAKSTYPRLPASNIVGG